MKRQALFLAASIVAISTASPAFAQVQEEPSADKRLDIVTVTAVKREQDLQDVPVSVTAFSDEIRQELALNSLSDLSRFTPSLAYSPGDDRVFVRGIGRQTNTNGSEPGVATYADGVYDSSNAVVGKSDFFVDRVEVLRGPQGTLYGRNSIGGAINVLSKRPTDAYSASARLSAGNYESSGVQASISGPIAKGVKAKLAGSYSKQDEGYFKNVAGGPSEGGVHDSTYVELQIDLQPTDSLSIWLKADTSDATLRPRRDNSISPYDLSPVPTGSLTPGTAYGYLQPGFTQLGTALTNPGINDIRKISTDTAGFAKRDDDYGFAGIATWSLPTIDLKYLGGYRTTDYNSMEDSDGTSITSYRFPLDAANVAAGQTFTGGPNCQWLIENVGPICDAATIYPSKTFGYLSERSYSSHEITAQSTDAGKAWWIVGAYYYDEDQHQESHFGNRAQPQLQTPYGAAPNPSGNFVTAISTLTTTSSALFGQMDYALSDTLTLTGGLRYSVDEKSGSEAIRVVGFGNVPPRFTLGGSGSRLPALDFTTSVASVSPAPGAVSAVTIDPATGFASRLLAHEWEAVTGVAGVQWQPTDNSNYFLKYSRGYKSGGFNAGGISQFPLTGQELLDAFEIGAKRTFGDEFQLNATAFLYAYDGLQIPLNAVENSVTLTRFFNIDESEARGIEIEGVWTPADDLRIILAYAYNDSEVKSACCFVDTVDPRASQPSARPVGPIDANGNQPQSLEGSTLPRTVPHKIGLAVSQGFDLGARGHVTLSGTYSWQDAVYHGIFNRDYNKSPSFDQMDLVSVWTSPNETYRVIGFVKNVFDEVGYDGASGSLVQVPFGQVRQTYVYTPPRTYGVQLQLNF